MSPSVAILTSSDRLFRFLKYAVSLVRLTILDDSKLTKLCWCFLNPSDQDNQSYGQFILVYRQIYEYLKHANECFGLPGGSIDDYNNATCESKARIKQCDIDS